jgi:hypothetical protein
MVSEVMQVNVLNFMPRLLWLSLRSSPNPTRDEIAGLRRTKVGHFSPAVWVVVIGV